MKFYTPQEMSKIRAVWKTDKNRTYKELAEALNEAGIKTAGGKEFKFYDAHHIATKFRGYKPRRPRKKAKRVTRVKGGLPPVPHINAKHESDAKALQDLILRSDLRAETKVKALLALT